VPIVSQLPTDARRLLALDVGDRRIGVAVSDPTGLLATPVEVYTRRGQREDVVHLRDLAADYEAEGMVVGLPVNMNGTEGPQAAKAREFAEALAGSDYQVLLWDERLSTVEAERRMAEAGRRKRRGVPMRSDAEAAAVILETYLDALRARVMR
jgi:putative Holliday junction resolvase